MNNIERFRNIELAGYPGELKDLVENYVLEILSQGRPNWDVPHTLAVVKWANRLANAQGLDVLVLTTAAYLHDIGYYGQFDGLEIADLSKVMDNKERHMIIGAAMARSFLDSAEIRKYLTAKQIERIIHLVSVHDKVEQLEDLDELVLMEADSLGAIDIDFVEPTYKGLEAINYLETRMVKRRSKFITPEAMRTYDDLAERFRGFIEIRDFLPDEIEKWVGEGGSN